MSANKFENAIIIDDVHIPDVPDVPAVLAVAKDEPWLALDVLFGCAPLPEYMMKTGSFGGRTFEGEVIQYKAPELIDYDHV